MVRVDKWPDLKTVLADNLKRLKDQRKLSQEQIAIAAGVSQSSVGRAINGTNAADLDTLRGLAKALDAEPWQLLVPGLKPDNLPVLRSVDPAEEALYERLRTLTAELAALKKGRS